VYALRFGMDGVLAVVGEDRSVSLWPGAGAGPAVLRVRGHEARMWDAAPLPDGRVLTAGEDGACLLWRPDGAYRAGCSAIRHSPRCLRRLAAGGMARNPRRVRASCGRLGRRCAGIQRWRRWSDSCVGAAAGTSNPPEFRSVTSA
jgi:hypothetical protein